MTTRLWTIIGATASAALLMLCGGCSTTAMKGTPFYTGEYAKRNGPAEQRVNVWPIFYYRDPALAVVWPIFELTDDHTAVRPIFSVYGLDQTNRKYNLVWPLVQFDWEHQRHRIFPLFWGEDYRVLFPVYWHFGQPFGTNGGSDSIFPLYLLDRKGTNHLEWYSPWPLVHWWSTAAPPEAGSMVFPLYRYSHDDKGSSFLSLPWLSGRDAAGGYWRSVPLLYYQSSNATATAFAIPVWAQGRSSSKDWRAVIPLVYWDRKQRTLVSPLWARWQTGDQETYLAPWALSWWTRQPERDDLWLAAYLAHGSWGLRAGSHYAFPFYFREAADQTLLTLLCGWQGGGDAFIYPLTPLAGVRTGNQSGSWLFPLYSHTREKKTGNVDGSFCLFGGYEEGRGTSHAWLYPLLSLHDHGPLESELPKGQSEATFGKKFWCLPWCWYQNQCHVFSATAPANKEPAKSDPSSVVATNQTPALPEPPAAAAPLREYSRKHGVFPVWSYSTKATPAQKTTQVKGSVGVRLFDYKHETEPSSDASAGGTKDYTRARVLWRLWHYERLNGDVSVDVFPTLTYDRHTDGFCKTSFLWRLFRYERAATGEPKLDVLFVPLKR